MKKGNLGYSHEHLSISCNTCALRARGEFPFRESAELRCFCHCVLLAISQIGSLLTGTCYHSSSFAVRSEECKNSHDPQNKYDCAIRLRLEATSLTYRATGLVEQLDEIVSCLLPQK